MAEDPADVSNDTSSEEEKLPEKELTPEEKDEKASTLITSHQPVETTSDAS